MKHYHQIILALAMASLIWSSGVFLSNWVLIPSASEPGVEFSGDQAAADGDFASHAASMQEVEAARGRLESYVKSHPDDLAAKVDYALVLLRFDEYADSISVFREVLKEEASDIKGPFFQAHLGLALALTLSGDEKMALEEMQVALAKAPDEESRRRVREFMNKVVDGPGSSDEPHEAHGIERQETGDGSSGMSQSTESDLKLVSPATEVERFFSQHSVLGRRLVRVKWVGVDRAEVLLDNFPFDNMPLLARDSLQSHIRLLLDRFADDVSVELKDSVSDRVFMVVKKTGS